MLWQLYSGYGGTTNNKYLRGKYILKYRKGSYNATILAIEKDAI